MHRSGLIASVVSILGLFAVGCQNKLQDENVALYQQNRELQAKLSDAESRLKAAPDPAQLASMQQEISDRDAKIADLQSQLRQPAPGQAATDNSLAGIEVTRNDREGTMTVTVPGSVLFDSGTANLKNSARSTLNKIVAAVRKDYPGKMIMVDGYTDTDPISRTKDKWKDNLDLSAARARTVAEYLVTEGISTKEVHPRGMSDTNSKGNKASSRRVEIVVATR
ncbi:MAG TPA: OmpA family protein [Tepidisphaeraceae bacterium]|nr:OmpA family protein [Tepidisphaeraceae bacterium]